MAKLPNIKNLRMPRFARGVIPLHPNEAATHQRFGTNPKYISTNPETGEKKSVEGEGYGIYLMEPHKYLSLAVSLKGVDSPTGSYERKRLRSIRASVENVGLKDMPMLIYDPERNEIVGHEGRHRAIVAQQMEKKLIPVRIQDTWRYQKPHFNFDSDKVKQENSQPSKVQIIRSLNEKYEEKEAEVQIEKELQNETDQRVFERRLHNAKHWDEYLTKYPESRPHIEREWDEEEKNIKASMERIGTGKTAWGVAEKNRDALAEAVAQEWAKEKPYKYTRESQLIPKHGGYPVEQAYEIREGAMMPVERPKEIGVGFSTLPDQPTRAVSEPSEDMFMTKEGRKEARKYAGSEEEIDEELDSLYGKD